MDSKNSESEISVPPEMSGIFRKYYDRRIADDCLSDLEVILLSMHLTDLKNKKSGIKYESLKRLFVSFGRKESNFRKAIFKAKKQSFLKEKDKDIHLLILGLKKIDQILGRVGKSPVLIIKSGQNFSAITLFEEFLKNEVSNKDVLLCDSHISPDTLNPFSTLNGKIKSLKILTTNVYDRDKFNNYKKKLSKELSVSVEVKSNKKIHDRFIIIGGNCWSIGASIKDLGNKDTIIKDVSEVVSSMRDLFMERWSES